MYSCQRVTVTLTILSSCILELSGVTNNSREGYHWATVECMLEIVFQCSIARKKLKIAVTMMLSVIPPRLVL